MNEVAVLVAEKDVCIHVCVCIAVRTNERTLTTFFLRSRLHLTVTTVLINTVLIATAIESRTTKQTQEHITDAVIALARASSE